MDADTIANIIRPLSKRDFDAVVTLLLVRVFHLKLMDVDGKGDGGSDWRVFKDPGGATTAAYQVTVQLARWQEKALEDARKAINVLKCTRYFFLTSRAHDAGDLRVLEGDIISSLGVPATCLGANEIGDLLVRARLIPELLDAIQMPVSINLPQRPDRKEVLLHAYVTLGQDTADLRGSVYDDTILLVLRDADAAFSRDALVDEAAKLLECREATRVKLDRRIDSLLVRGHIDKSGSGSFKLAPGTRANILASERIYASEFDGLASAQQSLMQNRFKIDWHADDAKCSALLLARAFIYRQLETARSASLDLMSLGFTRNIGDPLQELRDLLAARGVPIRSVNSVLLEFVQNAEDLPIINKLSRAAVYVAVEGSPPLSGAKAIGASNWGDVAATIDASVAIPYLCARRFSPTRGRFSRGSTEVIRDFLELGASVSIPTDYLNECASHLLAAMSYARLNRFEAELQHSRNGFVAHYFALRSIGAKVPSDLLEYLHLFSPSLKNVFADKSQWVRRIMSDLQPLFRDHGIEYEFVDKVPQHFVDDVSRAYAFKMKELGRDKFGLLVNHDVSVLAHLRRCVAERGESRVCLTWDGVMIGVGWDLPGSGWVVSPHEAVDFIQGAKPIGEARLISLAHSLAGITERPMVAAARIIDTVVRYAAEKLDDWEFQQKVDELKNTVLGRVDLNDTAYRDHIEDETSEFLRAEGISVGTEIGRDQSTVIDDPE